MVKAEYKFLKFVRFTDVTSWSAVSSIRINSAFGNSSYIKLSKIIKRIKEAITIQDDTLYTRITIKQYGQGLNIRDTVLGKDIGTKRQFVATQGQLIVSGIDARNGSFGIVTKELDGAIVTNDFWLFELSKSVVPQYLMLLLSSEIFQRYWQSKSSGTTNRQRINQTDFLNMEIPLPEITTQKELIERYNRTLFEATVYEDEAKILSSNLEFTMLSELGIEISDEETTETEYGFLKIIKYKDILNKWECSEQLVKLLNAIKKGRYNTVSLSPAYKFVTRSWNKREYAHRVFNYIEIGGVDPEKGIVNTTSIEINKAPSRATQIVNEGDLIIGTTRPYLKKFAIVGEKENNFICSSGFQVIKKSDNYNLDFLLEVLKSPIVIKQFEIIMTGALYPAINQEQLKTILVPFPPIEIQNEIAKKIAAIKTMIINNRQNAADLYVRAKKEFEEAVFGE